MRPYSGQLIQHFQDFHDEMMIQFQLNTLPSYLQDHSDFQIPKTHSENLLCICGDTTVLVIDIDNEQTIF